MQSTELERKIADAEAAIAEAEEEAIRAPQAGNDAIRQRLHETTTTLKSLLEDIRRRMSEQEDLDCGSHAGEIEPYLLQLRKIREKL